MEVYTETPYGNLDNLQRIVRRIVRYVFDVCVRDHDRVSELVPDF